MARIIGINIPDNKHATIALTAILGIGRSTARKICIASKVRPDVKIKDLDEKDLERIRREVVQYTVEGDLASRN